MVHWDGVCISVGTVGYNVGRKLFQNKVALGFVRLCLAILGQARARRIKMNSDRVIRTTADDEKANGR